MGIVLDIIFIIVLLIFVFLGLRRGFVRSLVEFVGSIAALLLTVLFSNLAADFICGILEKSRELEPLQMVGIKALSSFILYTLLLGVVRIIARTLDTVAHLPLIHQVNALLGAVLGALKGVVLILLLCAVLELARPYLNQSNLPVKEKDLQDSVVFSFVIQRNPLQEWLRIESL